MSIELAVGGRSRLVRPEAVVVAGFTGREPGHVDRHLAELELEGVARPARTPAFYLLPPSALIQATEIQTVHARTSGEAEIALVIEGPDTFVTLASDHTDRRVEAIDIGLSKMLCPKPLARVAWPLEEVADHWDELRLRSWILEDGERTLYQAGDAASLLAPKELLGQLTLSHQPHALAVLTGTVPTAGGIRPSPVFSAELSDPIHARSIALQYDVRVLDLLSEPA